MSVLLVACWWAGILQAEIGENDRRFYKPPIAQRVGLIYGYQSGFSNTSYGNLAKNLLPNHYEQHGIVVGLGYERSYQSVHSWADYRSRSITYLQSSINYNIPYTTGRIVLDIQEHLLEYMEKASWVFLPYRGQLVAGVGLKFLLSGESRVTTSSRGDEIKIKPSDWLFLDSMFGLYLPVLNSAGVELGGGELAIHAITNHSNYMVTLGGKYAL